MNVNKCESDVGGGNASQQSTESPGLIVAVKGWCQIVIRNGQKLQNCQHILKKWLNHLALGPDHDKAHMLYTHTGASYIYQIWDHSVIVSAGAFVFVHKSRCLCVQKSAANMWETYHAREVNETIPWALEECKWDRGVRREDGGGLLMRTVFLNLGQRG